MRSDRKGSATGFHPLPRSWPRGRPRNQKVAHFASEFHRAQEKMADPDAHQPAAVLASVKDKPSGRPPKWGPSLTAAARDGRTIVRAGMEEWLPQGPNKTMAPKKKEKMSPRAIQTSCPTHPSLALPAQTGGLPPQVPAPGFPGAGTTHFWGV
jgi:hypothetical protein